MSEVSLDDVVSVFGPLDNATIAQIIATGATIEDLKAAHDCVAKDAAHTATDHRLSPGPIALVVEIIERWNMRKKHPLEGAPLGNSGSTLT